MKWDSSEHSANVTDEYLFHQLIPYIGNKRKLLRLIELALKATDAHPDTHTFVDLFAGTGVVSRLARRLGYAVVANDWEPYSEVINRCYLEITKEPTYFDGLSYAHVISKLNSLPPCDDWVCRHLCPDNDDAYDIEKDRLFYMRKNGQKIDAIRNQIYEWEKQGKIDTHGCAALLAPLLYQCCYNSNTSGVFKGFHNGWGGQTGTALYRIKGDVELRPARFLDNGKSSRVFREDASQLADQLPNIVGPNSFIYLDPPYNQHPYGANYHVLNSVALWDKPELSPKISSRGDKAAIRKDWRTERRSPYNYRSEASRAYAELLQKMPIGSWVATSYSTDGMIPLRALINGNCEVGDTRIFAQPYKRYRVSTQRYSIKPMNIEFIALTQIGAKPRLSVDELAESILRQEADILASRS